MLGIVPGWGGIKRLPRLDRRAGRARPAVDRQDGRRAQGEAARPRRRMRSAAHHGEHRARRAARDASAARVAVSAVADAIAARRGGSSRRARASRSRSARGASTIRRRTRSSICGSASTAMRWRPPPATRRRSARCSRRRPPPISIRVFHLQERLKALGKTAAPPVSRVHVVGAGTMGGDIAAWCALRGLTVTLQDQDAAAARAGDEARREAFRRAAAAIRAACATRSTG